MRDLTERRFRYLYVVTAIVLSTWTFLVAGSLAWNIRIEQRQTRELAAKEARSLFNKDKAFRLWAASHGGVYVPVTARTPANPNLAHIPERDITTSSGKNLTLMNPAYMLRQLMNDYAELYGIKGRITAHPNKLFNPGNRPDKWETEALQSFERGETEVFEFAETDGQSTLRLMRPLFIVETCLKCHAKQGYKVGDFRGGVGVSVPMAGYKFDEKKHMISASATHGFAWLLGLGVTFAVARRSKRHTNENLAAERKLRRAKEEAEKSDKAKSEFLAAMSHELRTPMNAVLGFAQMLQYDTRTPLTSNQEKSVQNILDGGNHLLELINEILDLSMIEENLISLDFEDVMANAVIANCVSLMAPIGAPRHITIVDQFSALSPSCLRADRQRLTQILLNLLSNAVKYNKDGGVVHVYGQETDDGYLRIFVSDTGIGISEENCPGIFDMFHRHGNNAMIAREGTGIGLNVTKHLVERMTGRIGFESATDVGSTFWVDLPLATTPEAPPKK